MILLTLSRGKGEETVRLQLPASPAEIGETFAFLDRISLDTTATAILDVSSNVPVLYRCLYDVDVEDSEQFQKLQKLAERTEALSPAKAAIFSGALDAECVWNLEGALTVADRLDEYIWQLGPSAPAAMRFIGLDRMSGEYGGPDLTRYQAVFDGTVSTNSLDGIWEAFCRRSLGSDGQPLAISDLVELYDDSGSEFYYVDRTAIVPVQLKAPEQESGMTMTL